MTPAEEVQLAEDIFDPVLRDGLVEFFRTALHRDAAKRFGSLREMTRAWTDIFRDLDTVPPLTTVATVGDWKKSDEAPPDEPTAQASGAAKATADTPLAAAGLSPRRAVDRAAAASASPPPVSWPASPPGGSRRCAASAASPRYELVRRSREWRQRFKALRDGGSTQRKISFCRTGRGASSARLRSSHAAADADAQEPAARGAKTSRSCPSTTWSPG